MRTIMYIFVITDQGTQTKPIYIGGRHVFAKGPECPVLASYHMWFCQKLLKNAKYNSKNSEELAIFVKSTSGNAKILNFWLS